MAAAARTDLLCPMQGSLFCSYVGVLNQHVKLREIYEVSSKNPTPPSMLSDFLPLLVVDHESGSGAIYASDFALGPVGEHLHEIFPHIALEHCSAVFSGDFQQRMRCPIFTGPDGTAVLYSLPTAIRAALIAKALCNNAEEDDRLSALIKLDSTSRRNEILPQSCGRSICPFF
jgi:hypothetical protein